MSEGDGDEVLDLKEIQREIEQMSDEKYVEDLLRAQISEYEMLVSMFSNPGELTVHDYSVLVDFYNFLDGKTTFIPPQLNYAIHLNIDTHKVEMCIDLPLEYPHIKPDIFVRSETLSRSQQKALNRDLSKYVSDVNKGEICICSAVAWLQENTLEYFNKETNETLKEVEKKHKDEDSFSRYWIYSHHIYSKMKRKELLDLAQEYELTGFCLPGRPGIICFEGCSENCKKCWQKIKNMSWKKIQCKKVEEISPGVIPNRKFSVFEEICFDSGKTKKNVHMDLGELLKYLTDHQCEYMFKEYFGMTGK